jgi:hypothetical protein
MNAQKAFSKCAKTFNAKAKAMAEKTKDAYSFDRYGERCWLASVKFLLTHFAANQVEWILRSKHMRWAGDFSEGRRGIPMKTMEKYYADGNLRNDGEMPDPQTEMSIQEMVDRVKELREELKYLESIVEA